MQLKDVNKDTYYSDEVQNSFMSASVFKEFLECEAKGIAIRQGKYSQFKNDDALIYGNVVHSYFESEEAHKAFVDEHHADLYTKTKDLPNAKFKEMNQAIDALKSDETFKHYYIDNGDEYEKIVTGQIYPSSQGDIFSTQAPQGLDWIGKLDMVNTKDGIIGDIKTNRNPYNAIDGEDFITAYGYDIQLAIYQELYRQLTGDLFTPVVFAVSKTNFQTQAISLPQSRLDECLNMVKEREERIYDLIEYANGNIELNDVQNCGVCGYCISNERRSLRKQGIVTLDEFNKVVG